MPGQKKNIKKYKKIPLIKRKNGRAAAEKRICRAPKLFIFGHSLYNNKKALKERKA
jgi:hypothetical protein